MGGYIVKRLLNLIPVILGITFLVFAFLHLIPGDAAIAMAGERATPEAVTAIREQLGLNQPLPLQYILFLGNLLKFNFGNSIISGASVLQEITIRFPATFELSVAAMLIAIAIGIPAGVLAAVRKNRLIDNLLMSSSLIGVSMPVFWLGLLLIYLFAVNLPWLPPGLRLSQDAALAFKPITSFYVLDALFQLNWKVLQDLLAHLILPALTLSTIPLAIVTRITRNTMLEVLAQDYIRTARAKGVLERGVIFKHALKNALLPIVTIAGLQFGTLLAGAILTETIFSWPGIGAWIYNGILNRDYPVVEGGVVFVAVAFVLINLLVDISYALLDPRIRYQ